MNRGEIVDFEVTAEFGTSNAIDEGQTLPMLVTQVDEENGTASGIVFLHDGATRVATVKTSDDTEAETAGPEAERVPAHAGGPVSDPAASASVPSVNVTTAEGTTQVPAAPSNTEGENQ